jgi:hypothetical protein
MALVYKAGKLTKNNCLKMWIDLPCSLKLVGTVWLVELYTLPEVCDATEADSCKKADLKKIKKQKTFTCNK